jgi:hypothetical protein
MRVFIFIVLTFSCFLALQAQPKADSLRNYAWVFGYEYDSVGYFNYSIFSFKGDTLKIDTVLVKDGLDMYYTNGSICDSLGNLLFFSNGCSIMDANFERLGSNINHSMFQDDYCKNSGNFIVNSLVVLPSANTNIFNIFYENTEYNPTITYGVNKLYWSQVNVNDNILELSVIDSTIIDSLLFTGNVATCRHGNGKDWWLAIPAFSSEFYLGLSNKYYLVQVSDDKITVKTDTIGKATDSFEDITGEAVFSPDGTKYARYNIHADIQIFDFDRCSGDFSNPIHIPILDAADTSWSAGVAISPNSRYLYASSTNKIYQFDLQATDIPASKLTVAVYDGFTFPATIKNRFYQCELAPDGKIYVSCPGGKRAIHVIEYPDSAGLACNVVQHKYLLTWPIVGGMPGFPNFRLGALPDSICPKEMVVIKEPDKPKNDIQIYPNPVNEKITIKLAENINTNIQITNLLGQTLQTQTFTGGQTEISVADLPAGIVFVQVLERGKVKAVGKLVIVH